MKKTPFYGNRLSGGRGGGARRLKAVPRHAHQDANHMDTVPCTLACSGPPVLASRFRHPKTRVDARVLRVDAHTQIDFSR